MGKKDVKECKSGNQMEEKRIAGIRLREGTILGVIDG